MTLLSYDLLDWILMGSGTPYFFTNFITTQELSGPFKLYISPNIYHTQITEYSLESIFQHNPLLIIFTVALPLRSGPFGNTFTMLFQLK